MAMGTTHFLLPKPFNSLIPEAMPGTAQTWTYLSGAAELAVGVAVAWPRSRRVGATAAMALFVAVFPGNVKMAIDWKDKPLPMQLVAYGRLPLQVPLVFWAGKVRSRAAPGGARRT
jgi:uncharacterized membrane protein